MRLLEVWNITRYGAADGVEKGNFENTLQKTLLQLRLVEDRWLVVGRSNLSQETPVPEAEAAERGRRLKPQPVVVVVGRPNVGKSTLFNRLTRSRRALVHDLPGVTRDRIFGEAERPGGGYVTLVDTGGLLMEDEDNFVPLIRGQADVAIREGDA